MLKGLRNIVAKEVKELIRDPRILLGIILVPLLIYPLMGFMIRTSQEATMESMKNISVAVIDLDNGVSAQNLTNFLEFYLNLKVERLDASSIDEVASAVQDSNFTAVIVIPENFSENLANGEKGELQIYGVFRSGGIAESGAFSVIEELLQSFEQMLIRKTVAEEFPDNPDNVLDPVEVSSKSIVKGKPVDVDAQALFTVAMSQFFGFPLATMMLIILAMQLAATSVASEKEEKTLETLLSLPISRFTVLTGKLIGTVIVAAVGAIATIVGISYYMGSAMLLHEPSFGAPSQASIDLAKIGLSPGLLGYTILGASLFVSLLSALALAVVISIFAEDVRGAQSLIGFVYLPLIVPVFILMFTDIDVLPLAMRNVLLAIPFTHPILAARAMITGDYFTAIWGIAYVTIFTLAILYIAARIFATEKILTIRLRLRTRKIREE